MTMVLTSGMMSSHAQIGTLNANNAVPNNVGQADNADNKAVLNDLIEQVDGKIKDNQQVTVIVAVNDENMSKEHGITVPDITKVRTKDGLEDQIDYAKKSQDLLMSEMDGAGVSYQVVEVYDTVLNGMAIKTTLEDAKKIAELNEVKSMELSRTIAAPKLESNNYKTLDETSNDMIKATEAWSRNYSGKGQLIAILDSGVDPEHEIFKKVDEGSLRIKSEEDTKKFISEKKIDGGKYFNKKIPFGFNYADRNTNVKEGKVQSHGMHVAGIVAANGEKLKGVAPNAQLAIMRVFGQNSMGTTPVIYNKAIDDAVKMGVDSINMSLGATGTTDGRMEQTTIDALKNAQKAGIKVMCWDDPMENTDGNWILNNTDLGIAIGELAGKFIDEHYSADKKAEVALIGYPQTKILLERGNGIKEGLEKTAAGKYTIVAEQPGLNANEAQTAMETILQKNPDCKVVTGIGAGAMIGANEALITATGGTVPEDMGVFTADATKQQLTQLIDGKQASRGVIGFEGSDEDTAKACAAMYALILDGKLENKNVYRQVGPITAENAAKVLEGMK